MCPHRQKYMRTVEEGLPNSLRSSWRWIRGKRSHESQRKRTLPVKFLNNLNWDYFSFVPFLGWTKPLNNYFSFLAWTKQLR
jgi:hypothetical protein